MIAGLTRSSAVLRRAHRPHGSRKKLYLIGTVLMGLFAFPLFWLVDSGRSLVFLRPAGRVHHPRRCMYGPQATLYARCSRPTSASQVPRSATSSLRSSRAASPRSSKPLLAATGGSWSVSAYHIVACAVLTFVSVVTIREQFRRDLYETSSGRSPQGRTPSGD
ncbi:MHS family MFS transporter [Pseudonocardia sp. MCCB 268]|nr:MHS family MFS transporter [Pseudonocardia cytotoxica]